jgi:CBS domain-containing protein
MSKLVVTVEESSSGYDIVREMMNRDIGCIVVTKGSEVVGIVTKGDILRETIMKKADPQKTPASEIMSRPVVKIDPGATLQEATDVMSKNNVSKLPVVKDGKLVGIVTSSDLIRKEGRKKLSKKDEI